MGLSDKVNNHIDTLVVGYLFHLLGKVLRSVIDAVRGAVRDIEQPVQFIFI